MDERFRCAPASLARGEPLLATASRVRSWVLVEQPGPWGPSALVQSQLDPVTGRALAERSRATGVRVLLIRRPGWQPTSGRTQCFFARTGPRSSWLELLEVGNVADLLDLDWTSIRRDVPPGFGRPQADPVHLVCTHGRHDACCADLGRPVVRALSGSHFEQDVWECSHIGGDRFAANLVCLPDGTYFGRVTPEGAEAIVNEHRRGLLDLEHYRGRSCYSPLVQAGELFVRRATRTRSVYGLWPLAVEAADAGRVNAIFQLAEGGKVSVQVARRADGAAALTCSSPGPCTLWQYSVEALHRLLPQGRAGLI